MERFIRSDDIVLLLDNYSPDSQNLYASLQKAGCGCRAVVIEDDGFLPEDVLSVFGFFLGRFKGEKGVLGEPRYFNQIVVPDYWQISGTNNRGTIHDLYRERGRIFYAEPLHRRLVKIVDWYDERKVVRSSDHYNRYGALYARTTFNAKGQRVNKSWFAADGREILVENYVTGDIILNQGEQVRIFPNKTDFVLYVLREAGFEKNRIFYNSLSTPFFVSQRLHSVHKRDVLFWQEPINEDIPGNMQIILQGEASRTARIMVQKKRSYDRLVKLGVSQEIVHRLGFIYPFVKKNKHRREALICTNSDQIEHCKKIVEELPEMHFHIAALTEMSSKLLGMETYENVSLYPGVKMSVLDELFETCDYYLDINQGSEIVSAVYQAFLHNHLIFAFKETMHNRDYVADEHGYALNEVGRMIADIRKVMKNPDELDRFLLRQQEAALAETEKSYQQFRDRERKRVRENLQVAMYITNSYEMDHHKSLGIRQQNVAGIARGLGFLEMPVPRYLPAIDSKSELKRQVMGVVSAIKDNDIVVFQSPSWNGADYDKALLEEVRRHRNIRLVVFIHDVLPMMFNGTEREYQQAVEIYNMADLVIVPTESVLDFLRREGMKVKKVLIQPMIDLVSDVEMHIPELQRQIFFMGLPEEYRFISSWDYDVLLKLFTHKEVEKLEVLEANRISVEEGRNCTEVLAALNQGGFGLIWEPDRQPDYRKSMQSDLLPFYLAAGIPVIMEKGFAHEQTVEDYELGFVVNSLEEAAERVKTISEEEYRQLADNVKNISILIRGGFFTKKLLIDAVNYLMLG